MIRSMIFTNRFGRSMRCVFNNPGSTSLAILSVSGLTPGAATVNIHDVATIDGGYFGSARFSTRNIIVNFKFLDYDSDWKYVPIEETRHMAYSFFQPKNPIQVVVETDTRLLVITGVIEICDPTIFDKETSMQVSILCPGYYFKLADLNAREQLSRLYSKGLFEFPFSNESLDKKMIEFGSMDNPMRRVVYYDGDAENGMTIEVVFHGESVTDTIIIANTPDGNPYLGNPGFDTDTLPDYTDWRDESLVENYIQIDMAAIASRLASRYAGDLYADGNRIVITTTTGSKQAKFILADNTQFNILGYLTHLDWIKIYPGYNNFDVRCNMASVGHFAVNATYETLYTGV